MRDKDTDWESVEVSDWEINTSGAKPICPVYDQSEGEYGYDEIPDDDPHWDYFNTFWDPEPNLGEAEED